MSIRKMKFAQIFLLTLSIFQIIHCEEKRYFYRCGVDDEEVKPMPATNFVEEEKDQRRMGEAEFKDFNIYLDLINIKNDIVKFNLQAYEDLFITSLKKAVETLEALLKVENTGRAFVFKDEQITGIKIYDWNKTMIGTNAIGNTKDLGIDLFIFGRLDDQMDQYTLATAGPRYRDPYTNRPIVGVVNINTKVNYSKIHSQEYFQSIIIHEFTHILGFLKDYFYDHYHNIFTKTDEYGLLRYYINSTKVLEVAKKYFNCQDIDGVELEESGGSGTAGSHWEARILLGEYMNGVIYENEQVISEFTLALLEDTGFYKPNYYTGGLMRYGKGKGCDFIKKKCVDSNHEINPMFENEFYDSINSTYMDASCSSGRQSRAYHAWWLYGNLPSYYQYFTDPTYGGFSPADYCPVSMSNNDEDENAYYTGHCSSKGNGLYGMGIRYIEEKIEPLNSTHNQIVRKSIYYTSDSIKDITGETHSDHSFCYQSTLIKDEFDFDSNIARAICYESFCSNRSLTIKINDDYIVCPRSGGKIEVEGYKGFFLCPDYNLMCSGTVMCNDMFDCVDKKSELKEESYVYDYTIKTSQNLENAEIDDFENSTNYELSSNGICPQNCKHCHANNICIECRIGYNYVGSKNSQEMKCLSDSEINKGYYQENNIYYPCMSHCDRCSNDLTCQACAEGYDYEDSKCNKHINRIDNCEEYDEDGICSKCIENYAFKKDDRNACLNKDSLENYYTKNEGISYYPCEDEVSGCSKCYYDEIKNNVKCYLCKSEYALYEKDNYCMLKQNVNKLFYYINETHINNCSNVINNCNECENSEVCTKCKSNFYMVNDLKKNCIEISNINTNESYLNDDQTMYYSCNNHAYQDVANCKECTSKSNCELCQGNFTFIDGDKSNCVKKSELNNKYIPDPIDLSNYIRCDNIYNNCDTCNENLCLSCQDDSIFVERNKFYCAKRSDLGNKYVEDPSDESNYIKCEDKYNNCDTCDNTKCLSCKADFVFVNGNKSHCVKRSDLGNKYVEDPFDPLNFIKCENKYNNCFTCNDSQCISCQNEFAFIDGNKLNCVQISELYNKYIQDPLDQSNYIKCENKYNNCDTCNNTHCLSCQINSTFIEGNKLNCFKISELDNTYIKDPSDPFNFIKCENKYNNCHTCDNNVCESCKNEFTFVNGNRLNCVKISDLGNKYIEDPSDPFNFIECKNVYDNCDTCDDNDCISCKNGFTFINGNKSNCVKISDLNNNYIPDPSDQSNYISCEKKYNNCDTCNNTHCLSCPNDFTFIEGNKLNCVKISDLNYTHIQDPLDPFNYIKCEKKYNNCDTCNNNECISCKNEFTFIEGNKMNCVKISDLGNKYIEDPLDETNYIKCEIIYDNCDTCNEIQCISCKNDFTFINGNKSNCVKTTDLDNTYVQDPSDQFNYIKCEKKYNNCDTCNITHCLYCYNDFTFLEGNKLNCVRISELDNTYIQDPSDRTNYIKCQYKYNNCSTCNDEKCLSCKNEFTFINGNKLNCVKISDLGNKYIQDLSDESNYIKCDSKYNNCDSCDNIQCISCKSEFTFIEGNKSNCIKTTDLNNEYVEDPSDQYNYIKCENKYNNCATCNNTHCLSCQNDFTFIEGNKLNCVRISDLGNNYIPDPSDQYNYIKCDYKYNNCSTCDNNKCLSCKNEYTFINGNRLSCVKISDLGNKYIEDPLDETNYIKCENLYDNCDSCNNFECISCKSEYTFVNGNKSICVKKSDLNNGFIPDPFDQYNYITCEHKYNNCDTCNATHCLSCQNDFTFINGNKLNCVKKRDLDNTYIQDPSDESNFIKCEKKYNNCDTCDNTQCLFCKSDFVFINNNKLNCVKKSDLGNKYVEDPVNPFNFIECQNLYDNCDSCDNTRCISCKGDFTFINGNKSICIRKSDLGNKYVQDPSDQSNYIKCENKYDNCDSCNNNQCISCKTDYTFVNGNKLKCFKISDLDNTYIQDPSDQNNYINCEYKYNNCSTCNNNQCISCKNEFTFINGNKLKCVKISDLGNKYIQDSSDESNYIKCENKYNNCDSCDNTQCISCKNDFTFIEGNKLTCLKKSDLGNKYVQDPSDQYNYIKCENKYDNCDTCNNRQCLTCKNEYIFTNGNYSICLLKSDIDLQFYFTNDNMMYYSCNLTQYRSKKECKILFNETIEEEKSSTKEMFILQVQIINKLLKVFLTLKEKILKDFHIKFSINLFKNKQRNLQDSTSENQEVDLYLENDNDVESGNIVTLTSHEEFDNNDRVIINKQQSNDYQLTVLNNNDNILDTLENKKMIDNNEIIDFSGANSDLTINRYYIESSSTGCSFDLVSKDTIKENNKEIYLTFIEKDNINNNINAKCTLSSNNDKKIPCSFEQDIDEKNYDLQSYVGSNGNDLFYIFQDKDNYQLSCSDDGSKRLKIIIGIASGVVILLIVIITLCCCCKKKKVETIGNTERNIRNSGHKVISFNNNNLSSFRGINNQRNNLFH